MLLCCPQAASHYVDQVLPNSTGHTEIKWPKICIPVANALEIPQSYAKPVFNSIILFIYLFTYLFIYLTHKSTILTNAGHFDMISASFRSFHTRDMTQLIVTFDFLQTSKRFVI